MTLTVLTNEQVNAILEGLRLEELELFRYDLASALHEFSTNVNLSHEGFQQPPKVSTQHPESEAKTSYISTCGPPGMSCKVVSQSSGDEAQEAAGKPTSPPSTLTLFSPEGIPVGFVGAAALTGFRTALASACLVARRRNVKTITVFGSGSQAYWHIRMALMMHGSTIKRVHVINRHFSGTATKLLKKFGVVPADVKEREGWTDAQFGLLTPTFHDYHRLQMDQILDADIIYCCTPSREELFEGSILTSYEGRKKGRLIIAVGSQTPQMRELPEELLQLVTKQHDRPHRHFHKHAIEGGVIVVDNLGSVLKEAGEIISAKIGPHQLVELGELVMLHRMALEDTDTEVSSSQASMVSDAEKLDINDRTPAMSSVFGSSSSKSTRSRSSSPAGSGRSPSRKPGVFHHFRRSSSSSADQEKKKKEDTLVRWLRDGTVVYKSVGMPLLDLVVGMHLIKFANGKGIGIHIDGF